MISRDRHLSLVAVEGHSHISKLWRSSSKVMLVMFCWKTLMCHLDHIWFIWWFQFFLRKTSMSCLHQLWDWFTLLHYKYDKIHYIHIYCIYLSILYLFKDHQDWPIPACFFFSGMPCYSWPTKRASDISETLRRIPMRTRICGAALRWVLLGRWGLMINTAWNWEDISHDGSMVVY
jgi:hypothetical protein